MDSGPGPLVVLDTNVFYSDVEASRPILVAVLSGSKHGDFEIVVPQVVIDELVKQYEQRLLDANRALKQVIDKQTKELVKLGVSAPMHADLNIEPAAYEARLKERITTSGGTIAEVPSDLSEALAWAIRRRMPFKSKGEGMPDAAIWLTVLELAQSQPNRRIILVTANTNDFGTADASTTLHPSLQQDLKTRGLPPRHVTLAESVDEFTGAGDTPVAPAHEQARRLVADSETGALVVAAVEGALAFESVPAAVAALGIAEDEDPLLMSAEILDVEVTAAQNLNGGQIGFEAQVVAAVDVEVTASRSEAHLSIDESRARMREHEADGQTVEVSADLIVRVAVTMASDLAAKNVEVQVESFELAPIEVFNRALNERDLGSLLQAVSYSPEGDSADLAVGGYRADVVLQSDLESATLTEVLSLSLVDVDVDDELADEISFRAAAEAEGTVDWYVSAVAPSDLAGAESVEHGGGMRQGTEDFVPLRLDVVGSFAPDDETWNVWVENVELEESESRRRLQAVADADPWVQGIIAQAEGESGGA